jgi:hypothetical protein
MWDHDEAALRALAIEADLVVLVSPVNQPPLEIDIRPPKC